MGAKVCVERVSLNLLSLRKRPPIAGRIREWQFVAMDIVYVLHHVREDDEYGDDAKLIGVYRTADAATAAIERLKGKPGFRDHPKGFVTGRYRLDVDHWTEGFGFED